MKKEYEKPNTELIEYEKSEDILTASKGEATDDLYSEDEYNMSMP